MNCPPWFRTIFCTGSLLLVLLSRAPGIIAKWQPVEKKREPSATKNARPLALHPDNPHYFLFRGKPTILVTSGEHYGAVLNVDFDFARYLDRLHADGLNHTRTFA